MNTDKLPGGLWPVMLTPFLENNEVDEEGLKALTQFYIEAGAKGLFSNCLSSEMFQLTDEERLLVIRTVVRTAQGKVPVIAAATFNPSIEKCADFIKRVFDTGVVAVIIITNQILDVDECDDAFKKRIEYLMKLTGNIPLGTYECPDPYKRLLSPDLMQWLSETNRFFYHKDTSCDPSAIKSKLKSIEHTLFSLYNADTPTALMSLKEGAAGISPIGANFYPELYASMIRKFKEEDNDEELNWLSSQLTLMDAVADQCYPFSAKLFLQRRGLPITTVCRIHYNKMKPDGRLKLQSLMEIFKKTASGIDVAMNHSLTYSTSN